MVSYQELQKHRMSYDEQTRNEYTTIRKVVWRSKTRIDCESKTNSKPI